MNHKITRLDIDSVVVTTALTPNGVTCVATKYGVYIPDFEDHSEAVKAEAKILAAEYFSEQEAYQLPEDTPKNLRRQARKSDLSYEDFVLMTSASFELPSLISV